MPERKLKWVLTQMIQNKVIKQSIVSFEPILHLETNKSTGLFKIGSAQ